MQNLKNIASQIRRRTFEMCVERGGHLASSLSCIEILTSLYFSKIFSLEPCYQQDCGRDKFILSKGHAEAAFYATLAMAGFFGEEEIEANYRCGNYLLGGHPDLAIPGVEATTGALGHGLGIACGMALADKYDKRENWHIALLGDAECMEGTLWEAAHFASIHALGQLIVIVDKNGIGCSDFTNSFAKFDKLPEIFISLGWNATQVDGHDLYELVNTLKKIANRPPVQPTIIIAHTIKGKGISYMENIPLWHVMLPNKPEHIAQARQELK